MTKQRNAAPTQDTNGTWSFIVDLGPGVDSKGEWRERRQARRRGFSTRKAAQAAMDDLRVASRQGTFVAPQRQTLKAFLEDEWLPAVRRQLAESTFDSYERNVRHHIVPRVGGIQLQALDGSALNRLYADLLTSGRMRGNQSPGLKPRTVRYVHTILHSALDDAVKWRRVSSTPPIRRPRRRRSRRRPRR